MIIVRYADIYKTIDTEQGMMEVLSIRDATLPVIVNPDNIGPIQPYIGSNGKLFKNVSCISYNGEIMKVVGNYKSINEQIKNYSNRIQIKGFIHGKNSE